MVTTGEMHKAFWKKFIENYDSNEEFKNNFKRITAQEDEYRDLRWGQSGIHICLRHNVPKHIITVELYIDDAIDIYNNILNKQEEINNEYGKQLKYERTKKRKDGTGGKAARIYICKELEDLSDKCESNNDIKWMMESSLKLKKICNNYIVAILKENKSALLKVYSEIDYIEDQQFINKNNLNDTDIKVDYKNLKYNTEKILRADSKVYKESKVYYRNRQIAENALALAEYKCEIDKSHWSFKKRNGLTYMESHHLIPMAYQDRFDVSLDREQNIICLCSTCHKMIHYGKNMEELLEKLYNNRKILLEQIGIKVTFDELLEMYK